MNENPVGACTWHINDANITQSLGCCSLPNPFSLQIWAVDGQIGGNREEERIGAKVIVHDNQGEGNNLHDDHFKRPIEQWRRLSYPHLLTLLGTTQKVFVLEHGQDFRAYVSKESNYSRVFRVLYEVLLALLYLHERGFTHGAVDLDHIVIGDDHKAKLVMDFKSIRGLEPEADPSTTEQRPVFQTDERQFLICVEKAITYANARRLAIPHGVNPGSEVPRGSEHADAKTVNGNKLTPMEQLTANWDPQVRIKACRFIDKLYRRSDELEAPTQLFSSLGKKFEDLADDESDQS